MTHNKIILDSINEEISTGSNLLSSETIQNKLKSYGYEIGLKQMDNGTNYYIFLEEDKSTIFIVLLREVNNIKVVGIDYMYTDEALNYVSAAAYDVYERKTDPYAIKKYESFLDKLQITQDDLFTFAKYYYNKYN